jgi:GGDEF domain-containing protein
MSEITKSDLSEIIFDIVPFAVYIVDVATYKVVYANRQAEEMAGTAVLVGGTCHEHLFNSKTPCTHCKIDVLLRHEGGNRRLVYELFNEKNDNWYQLEESIVEWADGRLLKCTVSVDINQLKKTQNSLAEAHARLALTNRELKRLSTIDALTGLYNRAKLDEIMSYELKKQRRYHRFFSIILLDIDDFKSVNDTRGHLVGDLVFRWGGEEFLITCPETDRQGASSMAENLRVCVAAHEFQCGIPLTISLGVAMASENDEIDSLIARADKALYAAKSSGKNTWRSG